MPISAQHTKFTYPDYIAPLPADDFIKVAYKKQELFDEGVAKVQSTVDAYSNLRDNIYTQVEREYFDQTMDGMVKAINSSAGLDFSVKANTQAVLNIGKPLERDNNIMTALKNGKEIQRRMTDMSKLDSNKRFSTNDQLYMKDVNQYLKTNKLGQSISYGKEYEAYFDISEDWNKFFKNLPPDAQEDFYKSGNTPTGYLEKITVEGFNKSKVGQMFESYLSTNPKALRQLQIDAEIGLDNLGPEQAHKGYIQYMTEQSAVSEKQIAGLKDVVATRERSYNMTKSPTLKAELEKAKQDLEVSQQSYLYAKKESETPIDQFNISDYFHIYKNSLVSNMANLYAGQKVKKDLITDKAWERQNDINKILLQHDLDKEQIRYKAGVESMKPENLLKARKETMDLYKVDPQDFKLAPSFFNPTDVNVDLDNKTMRELTKESKLTKDADRFKGVLKFVPATEKKVVKDFLESLQNLKENNYYVVSLKNGSTGVATGEQILNMKKYQFDEIEGIAESNETSTYSGRRKFDLLTSTQSTSSNTNTTDNSSTSEKP
jgi:hypothetical protein